MEIYRKKNLSNRLIQSLILFLFISALLFFLDFGLFSVSFVFGGLLIITTIIKQKSLLKIVGPMWFLLLFLIFSLFSLLFSEIPTEFSHIKIYIQTIYWFILSVIVFNFYLLLDKSKISKYIFYSSILLLALYVLGLKVGSQNGIAFTVVIYGPLGYYFLKNIRVKLFFVVILLSLMLLNGSRSGALIMFIQSILIFFLSFPSLAKNFKKIGYTLLILMFLILNTTLLESIGSRVYSINNKLGELLIDTEYVLNNDMSWLQRKAQIQKGKQIFNKHPLLGIGYTNFVDYKILINESAIESDRKLRNIDNRSAHNSYVALLAETGLLGLSSIVLLLLISFITFWKNLKLILNSFEAYVFVSLVGLIIYFYTISGHQGTSVWIMYGLIAGAAQKVKQNMIFSRKT